MDTFHYQVVNPVLKSDAVPGKVDHRDLTLSDILDYEVRSSWWASWIGFGPLQTLAGKYFAWKSRTKFARYQESIDWAKKLGRR